MSDEVASGGGPRLSVVALLALAAGVVVVAFLLVKTNNSNAAPFTATQVHPKLVSLRLVYPDGPGLTAHLVGRVEVDEMSASDASYEVIVVDNHRHRVIPSTGVESGWDPAVASLRERFDWQPSEFDQAVRFEPGTDTSASFDAELPDDTGPVTDLGSDVTVVLALTHGSNHVYWAVKLAYHG